MKIIISPTKTMTTQPDHFLPQSQPAFLAETKKILTHLQKLSLEEATKLWKCSAPLALENYERIQQMVFNQNLTPAIVSYKGLQYQYMAPDLFTEPALTYIQENLRILSGFYGVLRPFDGIVPYRLEMQAPLPIAKSKHLYDFWGNKIYTALFADQQPVINLASKEYSKTLTPYLKENDQLIDIAFMHAIDNKLKVKATLAKMARGEMVRYLAENQVKTLDEIKQFDHPHYRFSKTHSSVNKFVFLHQE
ncbi:peroxide stress protein YaaA [Enterococcus alcedinis]|uniref:UPF0246 protein GCM10011482_08200 n=1 Tax=Enterococcus alcedinis TaxID=1274384 RepID=A0A917N474_9ENTE|nr:peroxide stress protein YaaA [Enterococcus alcedinis]MBP2101441.1 cytoplasmic iron level regulating protein YaaA (DUF328/UPF0246 family) [Enterococcus alcedinis]GGI65166.1 UPF0246 protein [Enterococcus alcedinis]